MKKRIFISNFRNNVESVSDFISSLKQNSTPGYSSIHEKNLILQIVMASNNVVDPAIIEKYQLTCVVEDDLFRTVYLKGKRIMWNPVKN